MTSGPDMTSIADLRSPDMTSPGTASPDMTNTVEPLVVAIDGPAGAGKSTIAKAVAEALELPYLDTGAMYRSVTWAALDAGVDSADTDQVQKIAETFDCRISRDLVTVDGIDVTAAIRSPEVTAAVSAYSTNKGVRDVLRERQRQWAFSAGGGVMEGRDIGTVVFPDAPVKIFLTASIAERARRRALETGLDQAEVEADMRRRDEADSTRDVAPLVAAGDAIELDTTAMTPDAVVAAIVELAQKA